MIMCPWPFQPTYSPLLFIRWGASQVLFFILTMSQLDWPITYKKKETMEAPQNRRFYFEIQSSSPLAHLCRWKEDNICQSIWDKSEVLLGTLWGTCQELGNSLLWPLLPQKIKNKNAWMESESGQSTLGTKHNFKNGTPHPRGIKKGGTFTPWNNF